MRKRRDEGPSQESKKRLFEIYGAILFSHKNCLTFFYLMWIIWWCFMVGLVLNVLCLLIFNGYWYFCWGLNHQSLQNSCLIFVKIILFLHNVQNIHEIRISSIYEVSKAFHVQDTNNHYFQLIWVLTLMHKLQPNFLHRNWHLVPRKIPNCIENFLILMGNDGSLNARHENL